MAQQGIEIIPTALYNADGKIQGILMEVQTYYDITDSTTSVVVKIAIGKEQLKTTQTEQIVNTVTTVITLHCQCNGSHAFTIDTTMVNLAGTPYSSNDIINLNASIYAIIGTV